MIDSCITGTSSCHCCALYIPEITKYDIELDPSTCFKHSKACKQTHHRKHSQTLAPAHCLCLLCFVSFCFATSKSCSCNMLKHNFVSKKRLGKRILFGRVLRWTKEKKAFTFNVTVNKTQNVNPITPPVVNYFTS